MKTISELIKDPEFCGEIFNAFGTVIEGVTSSLSSSDRLQQRDLGDGIVPYGPQKKNGGHNHKYNKGEDRTPDQKAADIGRKKP
ncbi:hypothetical protein HKK58_05435 [Pseudomonas sp. ADAK22]|uniref:hypothetical protein n=1 Tax=Pseudomonas sp. ADAK22 TaxID=2730851 RepID=UPI0014640BEB|nr:hypothetical protein [Pseudomonas sp. ADAK22]QJI10978.1 hypothetical protein HKK58_05435 [Pseudomonas sp. ADAK22]